MKEKIGKLKISGQVFIWKYLDNSRNYPGWNLTADKKACKELSHLFDMMSESEWSLCKTVTTSKPMETELAVPNNQNGNAKWLTKTAITFCIKPTQSENYLSITEMSDSVEIDLGRQMLHKLKEAIMSISSGNGDFSISDENQTYILTFWWNLRK